ncbi:SGNH/GDSL hydrolase family protein [Agromyces sp. SYSU T00266]|uniref:SGNH/GDSL hydrolase family protein n=1 Tax=Agromyces zhanjiangensis TaxID=3158562 RepID=UPI0033990187
MNERLDDLTDERGWRFVDACAGLRTLDGRFAEGMTSDGLHPSEEGARVLGAAIAERLREGSGQASGTCRRASSSGPRSLHAPRA